ncbi:hypothetical protein EVG20_g7987 [Dentipellis fragilis]|uniref:Fungal-type protein kinase domain-containing protein n=1 Tax=Dentipellis fragilis TaxID=205917 RepID=A0A4Y9YBD4_9AGAM|nr:hypothetical protein EVG20_g7987 [Dentipellis fragilis]
MQSGDSDAHMENDDNGFKATLPAAGSDSEKEKEVMTRWRAVTFYGKKPEDSTSAGKLISTVLRPNSIGECGYYDTLTPATFCDDTEFDSRFSPANASRQKCQKTYRLITDRLGTVLWKFEDWKEVIQVVADVLELEALNKLERAGWRHGDPEAERDEPQNQGEPARSDGHLAVMSASRLLDINARQDAMDNIESVIWIFLLLALKYSSNHPLLPHDLRTRLHKLFDSSDCKYFKFKFQPDGVQLALAGMHACLQHMYLVPVKPEFSIVSKDDPEEQMADCQRRLGKCERGRALLKDSVDMRQMLTKVLNMAKWPAYGPFARVDLPGHGGSLVQERPKNRTNYSQAQEVARYGNDKPAPSAPLERASVKRRRTGEPSKLGGSQILCSVEGKGRGRERGWGRGSILYGPCLPLHQ